MTRYLRHLPAVLGVALLVGAIYVVQHEFRHLKIADISAALSKIPQHALLLSFGCTVVAYGILTFYDRLGTIYAGNPVSYKRVAFASFCAYALSHNLGFAAVSGAAVRYRLYSLWGLAPLEIAKVVAFCSLTFGLGGMILGGAILFFEPSAVPFFGDKLPHWAFYAIGAGLWIVVIGYVSLSRFVGTFTIFKHEITLPKWRMAITQVLLASVDVAATAAIFYTLLPSGHGLTYVRFLAVYLASYSAGLLANLPGGLGVFDTAMLLGLEPYLQAPVVLGAIVVFRLYYYIIPLFLAGTMFAGNEMILRSRALVRRTSHIPGAQPIGRWSEPDFAVAVATGAVAMCGALLLALGVIDDRPDFSWIDPDFADVAASASQFIPSLIGAALMVMAIGLSQRVTLAWGATIVLLLLAAGFTAAQTDALWIPAVLVFATLLVAPFRDAFYRPSRMLAGPLRTATALPLFALLVCAIALALFEPRVRGMTENSWWELILSRDVPNGLRIAIAFAVGLALLAVWRLLRPGRITAVPWAGEGRHLYASFGALPPVEADGMVVGEAGRSGIPFRRCGRVLLGLGDPVGADSDRPSAIWRFCDFARQDGLDPAVWRTGTRFLKLYGSQGMAAIPLDGHGLPLGSHDGNQATSSYLCCVAERDLNALLPVLPILSDRLREAAE